MNRKELNDTITAYRAGFDDGFHLGERREGDDIDTSHPAYKAGYDHGVFQYCETIEGDRAEYLNKAMLHALELVYSNAADHPDKIRAIIDEALEKVRT